MIYDVLIVGGGLVGLTAAVNLQQKGLTVALIDKKPFAHGSNAYSQLRVSALMPHALKFLNGLGLSDYSNNAGQVSATEVFDNSGIGQFEFSASAIGLKQLGLIVTNDELIAELKSQLQLLSIKWITASVTSVSASNRQALVELDTGDTVSAKLIIAADGANSKMRELLTTPLEKQSYEQSAIVGVLNTEQPHQRIARQWFSADGPLAFLPLKDAQQVSFVYSLWAEQAECLLKSDEANIAKTLTLKSRHALGRVQLASQTAAFPLMARHVETYISKRVVLLGDAAHTFHPLAGQGLNMGLLDVQALATILAEAQKQDNDIGSLDVLKKYQRARKGHNAVMISAMQFFHQLFAKQQSPLAFHLRNLGMGLVNQSNFLKNQMMEKVFRA